jgi:twinfilin-like protein
MLYSSCKAAVTGIVESDLQMEIVKKIEISEGSELTADFILDEVHPKLIVHKPQFMRPPPPQGRRRSKSPKPVGENGEDASNGAS